MGESIRLRRVRKSYGTAGGTLEVLKGVDLSIPSDGVTVLLGKSGGGKTTLLRLAAGLDTPDSGEILTPPGRRTAVVFQEPRLLPWLTVEKNIAFGLARRETTREKMDALLELTGLTAFARAKPAQLSGGMEQRAAIARALAVEPDFLLMDEPFAALDALTRETMREALRGILARRPCGVLFITHSVEEGLALGDRLFLLRDGQLSALPALSARENPDPVELAARKAEILAQLG